MSGNDFSTILTHHWLLGGISGSLVWFLAAKQSISNRRPDLAVGWQCGGILTILIMCGWAIKEGEWLGLALAIVVLSWEIRTLRRTLKLSEHGQSD